MPEEEGFLRRWSRLKAEAPAAPLQAPADPEPALAPAPRLAPHAPAARPSGEALPPALPTLEDVARLTADSDFSAFVAKGVDQSVRRLAMKKLFADPHFNLIDGLDTYMADFNKPSPMSAEMLAALKHSKSVFAPLAKAEPEAHRPADPEQTAGDDEADQACAPDEAAVPGEEADPDAVAAPDEPAPQDHPTETPVPPEDRSTDTTPQTCQGNA